MLVMANKVRFLNNVRSKYGFGAPDLCNRPVLNKPKLQPLCSRQEVRWFFSSGEPRSSFTKLSPQEPKVQANFTNWDCTEAGTTCATCQIQKLCVNLVFFNMYWSDWSCPVDTPYCDPSTNQCTDIQPSQCDALSFTQCPRSDGRFPILNTCKMYLECNDGNSSFGSCEADYVYSQKFGKCIIKLSDSDCKQDFCGDGDDGGAYPDYPNLYYDCEASGGEIKACAEGLVYNEETAVCESICNGGSDSQPDTARCNTYYTCSNNVATKQTCGIGGFNTLAKTCDQGYDQLCNEMALVDEFLDGLIRLIPFLRELLDQFYGALNLFGVNLATVTMAFGVSAQDLSDNILIVDYIIRYQGLPIPVINSIINLVLSQMPDVVQTIWHVIFPVSKRDLSSLETLPDNLINVLSEFLSKIDVPSIITALESQNQTLLVDALNIGQQHALEFFEVAVPQINALVGADVLVMGEEMPAVDLEKLCGVLGGLYQTHLPLIEDPDVLGFLEAFVGENLPCLNG